MATKEEHLHLSDDFFALAEIAASAEFILVSLDHLVDAHLTYLGDFNIGRKERHDRFIYEVLEDDTYIYQDMQKRRFWS